MLDFKNNNFIFHFFSKKKKKSETKVVDLVEVRVLLQSPLVLS